MPRVKVCGRATSSLNNQPWHLLPPRLQQFLPFAEFCIRAISPQKVPGWHVFFMPHTSPANSLLQSSAKAQCTFSCGPIYPPPEILNYTGAGQRTATFKPVPRKAGGALKWGTASPGLPQPSTGGGGGGDAQIMPHHQSPEGETTSAREWMVFQIEKFFQGLTR